MFNSYYIPSIVFKSLHVKAHLLVTVIFWYVYYPLFKDFKTETQKVVTHSQSHSSEPGRWTETFVTKAQGISTQLWGWDGWMASPTRWTCVWVNSGSLWWTGRPGMLRLVRSQRVGHGSDWTGWCSELLQSCPTLCDPMVCSLPASSVHGILQAGLLEWVAMPSCRGSSQPRDRTWVSRVFYIGGQVLYHYDHLKGELRLLLPKPKSLPLYHTIFFSTEDKFMVTKGKLGGGIN